MFLAIRYAAISFLLIASVNSSNNNIKATSIAKLPVEGVASYYADQFHGRTTANGEIFDMNALTCAHPSLPFGTLLKITNLGNDKTVIVRVNDRGPYVDAREIDLSLAAATQLGMISEGISPVKIELEASPATVALTIPVFAKIDTVKTTIKEPIIKDLPMGLYTCQIGVYAEESNAERVISQCEDMHLQVFTENIKVHERYATRIMIGRLKEKTQAENLAKDLEHEFKGIIIKRI
jgi:rare lipoprotein A